MTMPVDKVQIDLFVNAAQLCLQTAIKRVIWDQLNISGHASGSHMLQLVFDRDPRGDEHFAYFQQLTRGRWDAKRSGLMIDNINQLLQTPIVSFLMLSRLSKEHMLHLARLDAKYRPCVEQLFGKAWTSKTVIVERPQEAAAVVFAHVAQQRMTIRTLAEKTGLTQVALSKFKGGQDIRLSNVLKILKALGLRLWIE
ncbi:MAG: helix-turn-helix transcriptional regulator [Deltaproteobacteria bacterium]|nr:helix-turn-helix transcriptional regulator [Deltaproteobacteria bacterium]